MDRRIVLLSALERRASRLILLSFAVGLTACGGGGGSDGGSGGGTQPPTSFNVTTSLSGTGSGTISPTSRTVAQGSTGSFAVSPASGSTIASVTGCGGTLSGSTYTTGPITANCTVTVSFTENDASPPPEVLDTLVTVDPSVSSVSVASIVEVISPIGTGSLETQVPIATNTPTGQSLVLAVNRDDQIVLAAIVDSRETELSAVSTALALVRIAVGELPPGIVAADFDGVIRALPDFGHLVSIISEALERGEAPSTNPAVLDRIADVFRAMTNEPSLTGSAVELSTQGIWDSPVPEVPYELVSDPGPSGLLSLRITSSSPGWITLSNRMPIPWVVSTFTALRDSPEQQIESRIIAPSLLGSTIVTSSTYGFNLTVGQSPESRVWMARSLMLRTVKFGLSLVTPSNCADATLLAGLDAYVETQSDGSWGDWLAYFDAFFSAQNLSSLLAKCPGPGLVSDFFKAMSPYLNALKITNGVFQGTGLAFEFTYAREFWNPADKKFGVCVSAQGAVVRCAAEYEFIFPSGSIFEADKSCNAGISMAPGASVTPRIIGRDAAGDPTLVPSGLIYSSDKPEVVLVDRDTGTMTAKIVGESAVVTVTDLTSSPMAQGSCTVRVIVPRVSPSSATLKMPPADAADRRQTFRLTDEEGAEVLTPPGVIWQASPIGQQSIFPFTPLVNTNVTTWLTTDESVAGVVTVEALDPFSELPYGYAQVEVVSAQSQSSFFSGQYFIEECEAPDTAGSSGLATCGYAIHASGSALGGTISFKVGAGESANARRDFRVVFGATAVCDNATVSIAPSVGSTFQYPIRFNTIAYDSDPRDSHLEFTIHSWDEPSGVMQGSFNGPIYYPSASGQSESIVLKGTVRGTWAASPRSAFPKCLYPQAMGFCDEYGTAYQYPGSTGQCDWRYLESEPRSDDWVH